MENPLNDPRARRFEALLFGEDVPTVRRWLAALVDRGATDSAALVAALRGVVLTSRAVRDSYPHLRQRLADLVDLRPAALAGYCAWIVESWAPLSRGARDTLRADYWRGLCDRLREDNERPG